MKCDLQINLLLHTERGHNNMRQQSTHI